MTGKDELPGNTRGFLLIPVMFTFIFFLIVSMILLDIFSGSSIFYVRLSPIVIFGMAMVVTWMDWAAMNQKLFEEVRVVHRTLKHTRRTFKVYTSGVEIYFYTVFQG